MDHCRTSPPPPMSKGPIRAVMLSLGCSVRSAEPESAAASAGLLSRNGIGDLFQPNTRNGAFETRCQTGKGFWLLKGNLVPTHRTAENGCFEPEADMKLLSTRNSQPRLMTQALVGSTSTIIGPSMVNLSGCLLHRNITEIGKAVLLSLWMP